MADLRALSGMLEDQAQILRKAHKAVGKNPEWSRMAYHALEGAMASLARTQADVEEALNLLEKRAISD